MSLRPYAIVLLVILAGACAVPEEPDHRSWRVHRGDDASSAYSSLDQIDRANVTQLSVAWTYRTGDAREGGRSTIECNPIVVDGVLFATSPLLKVFALDAATGEPRWTFDPFDGGEATGVNRGVTYWGDGDDRRILFGAGAYLYALDAATGVPIASFGEGGRVDLREGLGRDPSRLFVSAPSPGIVYGDLLILGTALGEGYDAAPGHVRAFDVRTGRIAWTFHTIPQPGEAGYDTWPAEAWREVGGANAWGGLSLDAARGMVFLATGSAAFDFYGGNRAGQNLFGNSVVALDAATGERVWHFQAVHHDLWDYDLPAPPNLVTVDHGEGPVDAVAQVTKMGHVFLLDRETGAPLFPVEERPVPASTLEGEAAWPTQPFPVKPPPFVRQGFTADDVTDRTPEARAAVLERLGALRSGPVFTPPSEEGTILLPGTRGGAEWSGASFDPQTGLLYVNANELPSVITMVEVGALPGRQVRLADVGEQVYRRATCVGCHGAEREGVESFPALADVAERLSEAEIRRQIRQGRGQMPAFPQMSDDDVDALVAFLTGSEAQTTVPGGGARGARRPAHRYAHTGWNQLRDPDGYPGIAPPWGTLNAIDLNRGEIVWQVPLGAFPELTAQGLPPTGTQNLGGTLVTAGGLVFVGAAQDERFRAFDKATGVVLWEHALPAGGYATPSTYAVDGRQYVVIAAGGGGKLGTPSGDAYVAFAL